MVRATLMLCASASALEPTGLLQATVGMHSHLSAASDKASSMKKMEKEWQAAAKSGTKVADEVLKTVYDSMQTILSDAAQLGKDIQGEVDILKQGVTKETTDAISQHSTLMSGTDPGQWSSVCTSLSEHADCRNTENDDCTDRDQECDDKEKLLTHCSADNPLCGCANADNTAAQMKTCLEAAKAWYDNYHENATVDSDRKSRGFYLGAQVGGKETRCDLDKEIQECADGETTCNNQKKTCDASQKSAQEEFCDFDTKCDGWCSNYKTQYTNRVTTFKNGIGLQLTNDDSALNRNKDVCFAAKKVMCYINVIANGGFKACDKSNGRKGATYDVDVEEGYPSTFKQACNTIDGSGFDYDFCLAYTPKCDHLEVPVPDTPPALDCDDYTCRDTLAKWGRPEDDKWFNAYYKAEEVDCSRNVNFYSDSQPENFHSCVA